MDNVWLLSESFERAAFSHREAMENFNHNGVSRFEESIRQFSQSVDKLQTLMGMQAENDQRKATGKSMAYDEDAFVNI